MKISMAGVAILMLGAAAGGSAFADTVPLPVSGTVINASGACASNPTTQCAENYQFAIGGVGSYTPVQASAAGYSYTIGNTFNQSGAVVQTQSDFGSSAYSSSGCVAGSPGNCTNSTPFLIWNFQDNYQFSTPSSAPLVQGAVISFTTGTEGLSDLQARIVETNATSASALIGGSAGGVTVVDGWQTMTQMTGSLTLFEAALSTTPLAANTDYFLQIRGEAASAASYTGNIVFTAVPLPAAGWLLLSGLGAIGAMSRRRRAAA